MSDITEHRTALPIVLKIKNSAHFLARQIVDFTEKYVRHFRIIELDFSVIAIKNKQ